MRKARRRRERGQERRERDPDRGAFLAQLAVERHLSHRRRQGAVRWRAEIQPAVREGGHRVRGGLPDGARDEEGSRRRHEYRAPRERREAGRADLRVHPGSASQARDRVAGTAGERPADVTGYRASSRRSIWATNFGSVGSTVAPKAAIGSPFRSTRYLLKFHCGRLPVFSVRSPKSGFAVAPSTEVFANIGNVTP